MYHVLNTTCYDIRVNSDYCIRELHNQLVSHYTVPIL